MKQSIIIAQVSYRVQTDTQHTNNVWLCWPEIERIQCKRHTIESIKPSHRKQTYMLDWVHSMCMGCCLPPVNQLFIVNLNRWIRIYFVNAIVIDKHLLIQPLTWTVRIVRSNMLPVSFACHSVYNDDDDDDDAKPVVLKLTSKLQ